MPPAKLTKEIIEAAIDGFQAQKARIDVQIAKLRAMLSAEPAATTTTEAKSGRREFSAAAKKRMREAQQARWAKVRGEVVTDAPAKTAVKPKRRLSAAGKKRIIEASKKYWAAKKAAAKKAG